MKMKTKKMKQKKTCLQPKTMRTNPNPCYDKQIERNKKQLLNGTLFFDSFISVSPDFTIAYQRTAGNTNKPGKSFNSKCVSGDGLRSGTFDMRTNGFVL